MTAPLPCKLCTKRDSILKKSTHELHCLQATTAGLQEDNDSLLRMSREKTADLSKARQDLQYIRSRLRRSSEEHAGHHKGAREGEGQGQ